MQLVKYSPFRDFQKIERDMDKLWDNGWGVFPTFADTSTMDVYEENGNLVAEVSLPNFKKGEIELTTDGGVLEVTAEHKEEEEKKGKRQYYLRESSKSYFRRLPLPEGAKVDKTSAEFKNGLLKVVVPLSTSTKKLSKTVAIK
jgi:HSP20 family protein